VSIKRVFLLLVLLFFSTKASSLKILASEIDTNIKKAYNGLKSFSVNIVINIVDDQYKYFLAQDKNNVYIEWKGVNNSTSIKEEDIPVIPLNIKMYTTPYDFWRSLGIDINKISYDYVNHVPCLVIGGDKNRIFIDIEHFSIRKIEINNVSYLFDDFMYIGNYYLPHKIEIVCSDSLIKGDIEWSGINQSIEKIHEIRGSNFPETLIYCFPRFSEFFR